MTEDSKSRPPAAGGGDGPARGRTSLIAIHDARNADLAAVLELNREFERYLSPLSMERLRELHAACGWHRIAWREGQVAGFLLAFRERAPYDSPNYLWFAARYPEFLYVDRVVVAAHAQGLGIGSLLYEDLIGLAVRSGVGTIACEFDLDPPNETSERFHRRFGFAEVGRQQVGTHRKTVSLQLLRIDPARAGP